MLRISGDQRHTDIAVLLKTDLPEALFPDWSMATSQVPDGNIAEEIEQAQQDDAVKHLLELGKSLFTDCNIALAIREPGENGYSIQTSAEADTHTVKNLINDLPNHQFATDTTVCQVSHNGSVQWSPAADTLPGSTNNSVTCLPYQTATGVAVTDSEQEIIGILWVLSTTTDVFDGSLKIQKLVQLARSVANHIELRGAAFLTRLQQQNSQRQQLSIAANLRRLEAVVN